MKALTITINVDDETADFLQAAANMTGTGSIEKAIELMIIATRSRIRDSRFVAKTVNEMIDAVLPALREELKLRLVNPEEG